MSGFIDWKEAKPLLHVHLIWNFNREMCIKMLQKAGVTCTSSSLRIWIWNLKTKYYIDDALKLQCYSFEFIRYWGFKSLIFFYNSIKAILPLYHFYSLYKNIRWKCASFWALKGDHWGEDKTKPFWLQTKSDIKNHLSHPKSKFII